MNKDAKYKDIFFFSQDKCLLWKNYFYQIQILFKKNIQRYYLRNTWLKKNINVFGKCF